MNADQLEDLRRHREVPRVMNTRARETLGASNCWRSSVAQSRIPALSNSRCQSDETA